LFGIVTTSERQQLYGWPPVVPQGTSQ